MSAEPDTLADLGRQLKSGALTAEAVTEGCLARITERNRTLNAFITVLVDEALEQARERDREIAAGSYRGPLHGVPISLKDIIDLRDTPTTAASRVRDGHIARGDATVVGRLRDAGAVFIGKTNLHEFALGTTNEDSAYGPVLHPFDDTRSPGGSSGGSAVSILARMAYASIGTDTGGSIRIPAAACGLVGLKATIGEIPLDGIVPLSETLDHVGPMCLSVEDTALLFDVLRGIPNPVAPAAREVRGLRFGIPRALLLRSPRFAGRCPIRRSLRTAQGRWRRSRGRRHPPHEGDRDGLHSHRAPRGGRLSCSDARKPAAGLHGERTTAARDGALHPRRGLRPRSARPAGDDPGSQGHAHRTRWIAAAVASGASHHTRSRDSVESVVSRNRSGASPCG